MKNTIFSLIILLFWSTTFSFGGIASSTPYIPSPESRSADTCADASLTIPFVQGFNTGQVAYAVASVTGYTAGITSSPTSGWVYQGEVFLGWDAPDPQNFTTPFYRLFNPTTMDYISEISTDSSLPSVPGFTLGGILRYAYSTQVCGSVPLLGAFNAAVGNHYYTTEANVHANLLAHSGWVDAGVAVYVLPLSAAW